MRRVLGAVAVLGMLALSGCGTGDPLPTLLPTPSSTPVFASEEEALAAAEEAYAAYLEMSNLIGSEGGVDPERIAPFVTEERLTLELSGFERLRQSGLHTAGRTSFKFSELQQFDENGGEVVGYACWDGSDVRVLNSNDVDVTPEGRVTRAMLEVVLVADIDGRLVLESDEVWPSGSC